MDNFIEVSIKTITYENTIRINATAFANPVRLFNKLLRVLNEFNSDKHEL